MNRRVSLKYLLGLASAPLVGCTAQAGSPQALIKPKAEWAKLLEKPPGLMRLGLAYTSRKLKFKKGDYAAMIKNAHLANAFVKCFALMRQAAN